MDSKLEWFLLLVFSVAQILANPNSSNIVPDIRPPFMDHAARARYMVHKADWGILATISTHSTYLGRPFTNVISICDGSLDNSTGIPYMYTSKLDVSMQDIIVDSQVTLAITEAQFNLDDCLLTKNSDPENPLCSRLVLFGNMVPVTDTAEMKFAQKALFSRHPIMPSWPKDHNFVLMKIQLTNLWMIDYFGGGITIDLRDYFKAKPVIQTS